MARVEALAAVLLLLLQSQPAVAQEAGKMEADGTTQRHPHLDLILAGESASEAVPLTEFIFMSVGVTNSYLVTTAQESVISNGGMPHEGAQHRERFARVSSAPVRYLLLTQSHLDHIGGVADLVGPGTEVIAQARYPEVRGYWNRLDAFYRRRTQLIFGAIGGAQPREPRPDPVPDILFDDRHAFELGGRRFELLATPGGETTDSMVVWLPDDKTVFTGNLFSARFNQLPNLAPIRGDKIRSALRFVASLERVRTLAPERLITGHGEPIEGAERIQRDLARIRDAVLHLHDRTVAGMNAGTDLHTLMQEITLPPELEVGQERGKVPWVVRGIWHEYAGWFEYDSTASLYPAPQSSVHPDLVELAGADSLARRASEHVEANRPVEAIHLSDIVLNTKPGHAGALRARLAALELLIARSGENFDESRWLESQRKQTQAALER
jgi:glyoxylase-like metal-dependent hydrolase (beta-lactamase superfamily II)